MTEQDDRHARVIGGNASVETPQIVEALVPAAAGGEEAQILGAACGKAVAAMVTGIDGVAGLAQRRRQSSIARAMLGEPMSDLHDAARRRLRPPAMNEKRNAVRGGEREARGLHRSRAGTAFARRLNTCAGRR